jgi:hypothetical protein
VQLRLAPSTPLPSLLGCATSPSGGATRTAEAVLPPLLLPCPPLSDGGDGDGDGDGSADADAALWLRACVSEGELSSWLSGLRWQPLRLCVQHSLLHATACFADSAFELRRMAHQLLRPLVEVALWADLPALRQFWTSFLPLTDTLPCWVALSTLHLVLQTTHAAAHLHATLPAVAVPIASLLTRAATHTPVDAAPTPSAAPSSSTSLSMATCAEHVHVLLPSLALSVGLLVERASSDKVHRIRRSAHAQRTHAASP